MLTALISHSIRLRVVVLALCVVLLVVGSRSIRRAPLDVFPEFAPPLVEIQTEAPGLSTNEVESLVTMPIENALTGLAHVKTVRSKSVLGLSQVVLVLEDGTDVLRVRQMVQERINTVTPQLPTVALRPNILQPLSSTSRVMKIGILPSKGTNLTQRDLTEVVMWTIRPKLMSVPGVANVAVWGQRDKQFQVIVHPNQLRKNEVSLEMVIQSTRDAVALDAGGFVDTPNQRVAVRHAQTVRNPADLGDIVVDTRGAPKRLKDVAQVQYGSPPPIGDSVINDEPGIMLIVEKQPEANTLELTRKVEAAIEDLKPGLTGIEVDTTIFRPATFIERAIDNLSHALVVGCVLVAIILILFLFDPRTAFISLLAIPLSLVTALMVFAYSGATINTMVLAGLVIALGEVVDDAIIDVENIARRLRLASPDEARSPFRIVLAASLEVRSAVVYASLIVVLVFLPIFFLDGLSGAFFRPLAQAYVVAIAASLFVALTVTPALSYMLLTAHGSKSAAAVFRLVGLGALVPALFTSRKLSERDPPLTRLLKSAYRAVLPAFVARPWHCLAALVLAFAVTALAASRLGQEFLPNFQETDFLMHFVEKPGTSIEAMHRVTAAASKELRTLENEKGQKLVRNFGSHIGRAEVADEPVGPNFTELWISIPPDVDYEPTVKKIADVVYAYPGLYRDLLTYLRERIKEVLTGASGSVVVRLYGPDTAALRAKAKDVEAAMKDIDGVTNLKVEPQVLVAQIDVRLRPEDLAKFGLTPGHVRRASTTLLKGQKVGEVFDGQKKFDVVVWGSKELRTDLKAVQELPIDVQNGTQVRLKDVADVRIVSAPNEIRRENASRRLDVTCNVSGRDLGSVAREVEEKVRTVPFEREYHPEFLGEYAARQESTQKLYALAALALIGIVLLLYVDFQEWRPTLLVALTIPFALVGGVFAVTISTGVVSLGSMVGFVTVLGIAARNGIMLVSHFRHLEAEEGVPFGVGLILRGAEERLAPILMTALATGLALLPLAITGNKPGQEIEYPLAVVILGGLITSTLLNLFLLPPLYALFGRPVEKVEEAPSTALLRQDA